MQIIVGIGQFLLVTGVAFAVLCALVSFMRFQSLAAAAAQRDREAMDPNDAFQVHIAHRLGSVHRAPEPFCILSIAPDSFDDLAARLGDAGVQELMAGLEERIRKSVRSTDEVIHCGGDRVGLIIGAPRRFAELVARRVRENVEHEPISVASGESVPVTVCAGIVSHPENGGRLASLIEQSIAALGTARQEGPSSIAFADAPGAAAAAPSEPEAVSAPPRGLLDPLTGVLRSDRIGTAVQKYLAQHRRDKVPVSFLLVEIDHFTRYGERYGKAASEAILKGIGELLERNVRESDLIGRFGEQEFLVAMVCPARNALIAAQRLSAAVKKAVFPVAGSSLKITVSIGMAGYPDHGVNPGDLFDAASIALAVAKEKGRNICLLYDPAMRDARRPGPQTDTF